MKTRVGAFRRVAVALAAAILAPVAVAEVATLPTSAEFDVARRLVFGPPAGHAIAGSGWTLYVGFSKTFTVLSVADRTRPVLVGTLELDEPITMLVTCTTNWRYVFAVAGRTLYTVNVANDSAPRVVAALALPQKGVHAAQKGSYLYVLCAGVLQAVNVTDPAAPVAGTSLGIPGDLREIALAQNHAYVASSAGLVTLSLADPAVPAVTSEIPGDCRAVALASTTSLLVLESSTRLQPYDLRADPASPRREPFLPMGSDLTDIAVEGYFAYITRAGNAMEVVELVNPLRPSPRHTVMLPPGPLIGVGIADSYTAYVISRGDGIKVLDISEAPYMKPPRQLGRFLAGAVSDVAVSGDLAFAAIGTGGILAVDLTTGRVVNGYTTASSANDVEIVGRVLYVAEASGLEVLDITDPLAIKAHAALPVQGGCTTLAVRDGVAYLASGAASLTVVDVGDVAHPRVVTSVPRSGGTAKASAIAGDHLYVAQGSAGLAIYSLFHPFLPALVATQNAADASAISVDGDRAFLVNGPEGLNLFNVRIPAQPVPAGSWLHAGTLDAVGRGDLAYAVTSSGLHVLDVQDPQSPVERALYPLAPMSKVRFHSGSTFVAGGQGLVQLRYAGQCWDDHEPNDDAAHAAPLLLGRLDEGRVCDASDEDWFTVTPPQPGTVQVALDVPLGHQFRLFARDGAGTLIAASSPVGSREVATFAVTAGAPYALTVRGVFGDYDAAHFYVLSSTFTPCAGPTLPVYLRAVTLDRNANAVLEILDPNQPATVTGYDVFRSNLPNGGFTLRAGNAVDMDQGVPNTQWVDTASTGSVWYYNVKAYSSACGAEGP